MAKSIWMTIAVIFSLSSLAGAKTLNKQTITPKIVGGEAALRGEFSYIVSLRSGNYGHFCGGSLIAPNWVLTASHCVRGASVDEVWIGVLDQKDSAGVEKIKVSKIIAHPKYDGNTMDSDFALIQLAQNSSYKSISLNETDFLISDDMNATQIMATTAGWGALKESDRGLPDLLQKVNVPLVSQTACNAKTAYDGEITNTMLCAGYKTGGKDSCQGDSGGPLVVKNASGETVLAGVVSWGQGCARANRYGVYAKVSTAVSWIRANAK
jgi:trypsin